MEGRIPACGWTGIEGDGTASAAGYPGAVEQVTEWFVLVTGVVIGASHALRPDDWAEAFRRLHQAGRTGAFVNGGLSLVSGALILAGHPVWTFPGVVLTGFGALLTLKAAVCFLAPDKALRSMERGGSAPKGFVPAGIALLAIAAWAGYCLWRSA